MPFNINTEKTEAYNIVNNAHAIIVKDSSIEKINDTDQSEEAKLSQIAGIEANLTSSKVEVSDIFLQLINQIYQDWYNFLTINAVVSIPNQITNVQLINGEIVITRGTVQGTISFP